MARKRVYAVAAGRKPGIYRSWHGPDGAREQVDGFKGARYRGFPTLAEAEAWLRTAGGMGSSGTGAAEVGPRRAPSHTGTAVLARAGSGEVRVYTDGGCIGNPGPGGYGVVIVEGGRTHELSGGFRLTTNNRMEVLACIVGLRACQDGGPVRVYSDSSYVVKAMTEGWAARWRAHGWWRNKREKAENTDLWAELLELCDEREVEFLWVRGHSGHPLNERCDRLAMEAAQGQSLPADAGYERAEADRPQQLSFA
jgi:ribonuclease HI